MNNIFKVITPDGRALWFGFTRRDGDKELFEANESARLYSDGEIIADNFDVFPLEPEVKSDWNECRFTMPGRSERYPWRSDWLMCSDGEDRFISAWFPEKKLWETKRECPVTVSHWQPLPPLP